MLIINASISMTLMLPGHKENDEKEYQEVDKTDKN
jgi:hypothetical protein